MTLTFIFGLFMWTRPHIEVHQPGELHCCIIHLCWFQHFQWHCPLGLRLGQFSWDFLILLLLTDWFIHSFIHSIFNNPLVKISLWHRHAQTVTKGASSHKTNYIDIFRCASISRSDDCHWLTDRPRGIKHSLRSFRCLGSHHLYWDW